MAATIPEKEPTYFTAGDTVKWTKSYPDYLPVDSWVLTYVLVNASNQYVVTSTDNGDGKHLVTISAATTAAYAAGQYNWHLTVSNGSDRFSLGSGFIDVKPNYELEVSGYDTRSHVKKTLDSLEAIIENRASVDQQSYTIAGRSLARMTIEELLKWRDKYKALYADEVRNADILSGKSRNNIVRVRF